MRSPSTRTVAFGTGSAPVPSISVAFVIAVVMSSYTLPMRLFSSARVRAIDARAIGPDGKIGADEVGRAGAREAADLLLDLRLVADDRDVRRARRRLPCRACAGSSAARRTSRSTCAAASRAAAASSVTQIGSPTTTRGAGRPASFAASVIDGTTCVSIVFGPVIHVIVPSATAAGELQHHRRERRDHAPASASVDPPRRCCPSSVHLAAVNCTRPPAQRNQHREVLAHVPRRLVVRHAPHRSR